MFAFIKRTLGLETKKAEKEVLALLKRTPIFEQLSRRELRAIERILHTRNYQPEEIVFRQDEPGMGMYIIASGEVQIVSEPSGLVLTVLKEGDFFGELALIEESPRSATVIAKSSCQVLGFFQPDLFGLIERDSRLGVKIVLRIAKIIGHRLMKANKALEDTKETKSSDRTEPSKG